MMKVLVLAATVAAVCRNAAASPIDPPQIPLHAAPERTTTAPKLHGRFLHITDFHPDPFFKLHSSTEEDDACHRGHGPAGIYGAETSDCDSPLALVNATFTWIEKHLKDKVDFVVWTGDSARHDNDEKLPRDRAQVVRLNRYVAEKFSTVFARDDDDASPIGDLSIPIIPTFGNNDILPHNILLGGPNKWLQAYTSIWQQFIPEEQRHAFERGGWFYVEVIPNKLAVFSLNTLYFFDNNAAVDGCAEPSEPGYEHMEWLRIQLQFMRERGMKAILMGHVPPARTESKELWDETCWQKYTLWLQQYRDVVLGGCYGHMNVDHFLLQATKDIDLTTLAGQTVNVRTQMEDEFSVESASDYLVDLRDEWSKLPQPLSSLELEETSPSRDKKKRKNQLGAWGQKYQVTLVSPSVVPNYFPTLRVVEYNISGLEDATLWRDSPAQAAPAAWYEEPEIHDDVLRPKRPKLIIPAPPSSTAPPGPAYSPQTLTLLGYKQYYANLTEINNDIHGDEDVEDLGWHEGKHRGKHPKNKDARPKEFKFEVEYDTTTDKVYKLKDMTVLSYLDLAYRIGQYKPIELAGEASGEAKAEGKKKKKQAKKNKVWINFIQRAFVGILDQDDLDY